MEPASNRSQAVKDYLASVNQGLEESDWKITCIRLAPNDPRQNPVEDVWLQGKRFIREFYTYVSLSHVLDTYLSWLHTVKPLTFLKFLCMVIFHK